MLGVGGGATGFPGLPPPMPGPPSRCVRMTNMFDPNGEDEKNDPDFFLDLRDDVIDEVEKHGDVLKCIVLPTTAGHVMIKFASEEAAAKCAASLNGRWFAGKQVAACTIDEAEMPEA